MATILKQGKSDLEQKEAASKIQEIVSDVIMDIEKNGDASVRDEYCPCYNEQNLHCPGCEIWYSK